MRNKAPKGNVGSYLQRGFLVLEFHHNVGTGITPDGCPLSFAAECVWDVREERIGDWQELAESLTDDGGKMESRP